MPRSAHSSAHSPSGKTPSGLRFPLEFPCFGPSPEAVREVSGDLVRALEAMRPDLRIGWVTGASSGADASFGADAAARKDSVQAALDLTASLNPVPGRVALSAPAWSEDSWRAALADCDLAIT
ncbi:MAG: hypothetical protein ABIW76_16465, partial [Fibrobacteria bacterium]